MRTWLAANGGPLVFVVIGLSITGFKNVSVGIALIVFGLAWSIWADVHPESVALEQNDGAAPTRASTEEAVTSTCDIIQGDQGFRARLNDTEVPLANWRATKIEACRDIVARFGPRGAYVIDRTGAEPRADWLLFDNLA